MFQQLKTSQESHKCFATETYGFCLLYYAIAQVLQLLLHMVYC